MSASPASSSPAVATDHAKHGAKADGTPVAVESGAGSGNGFKKEDSVGALKNSLAKDSEKGANVHTFDPDAPPEAKEAQIASQKDALKGVDAEGGDTGAALAVDAGGNNVKPTTSLQAAAAATAEAAEYDSDVEVPGALPGPSGLPKFPKWYKIGWVGSLATESTADEAEGLLLRDAFYGQWWHNAGVIIVSVLFTHFLATFRLGFGWIILVLAGAATYYNASVRRVRRNVRDDISRELMKTRLATEAESADWINNFLSRFWLIYEPVLSATIVQTVDQVLSVSTPSFLDSIRMTQFTLGTKAPRIESVRTWPSTADNIVQMDWRVSFTPTDMSDVTPRQAALQVNPKIVLAVRVGKGVVGKALPILLEDMSFSGFMRIRLTLMNNFPHVKLVDVSFMEKPIFDYVLKPVGGETFGFDIGNIPGLSAFIRDQVHAVLGPMMYNPNVFTLNLEEMLSGAPLESAVGVLQITVHQARGLRASKIGGGSPDPYVAFSISNRGVLDKTKVKHSTHSPYWTEVKFLLINSLNDQLVLSVMDYNEHRRDSELGIVSFDLQTLVQDPVQEGITGKIIKDGKDRGELQYDVNYFPVLSPKKLEDGTVEPVPDVATGVVRLTIHQANNLDTSRSTAGHTNPFAILSLRGREIHRTHVMKRTIKPNWESFKEFLVTNKQHCMVSIKLVDDKDFARNPTLGHLSIPLRDLLEAKDKQIDWFNLSGAKSGRVRLSAEFKPVAMSGAVDGAGSYTPPIGIVRLWAKRAADVKNVEAMTGGKSDPYLKVQLGGKTLARTEVINNNLNPEWDEILYAPVHSPRETLVLECMDYQNLTKDRTLGYTELKVYDLLKETGDKNAPYESTGKSDRDQPLRFARDGSYKGNVVFEAEFVPALKLKNLKFDEPENEVNQAIQKVQRNEAAAASSASVDTASTMGTAHTAASQADAQTPTPTSPTRSTRSGTGTANSDDFDEEEEEEEDDDGVELSHDELLEAESGLLVIDVRSGQLDKKDARLEVLIDDSSWPSFSTEKARSHKVTFDQVGEAFIRELPFSQIRIRFNEGDADEKEDVFAETAMDVKEFLERCLNKPEVFNLSDEDGEHESTVELEARYVPVPIKLEPRESVNNQGNLRVDLIDAKGLRAADRSGKSDPYVVFTLNGDKIYKSETKKKTLTPTWDEWFETPVPSRAAANLSLEVFDWELAGKADKLGTAQIDIADLEPLQAEERVLQLKDPKHGDKGEVRISLLFRPSFIVKTRSRTSTFSTAGRALTQVGGIGIGAGKGVVHGAGHLGKGSVHVVGSVGRGVGGVFGFVKKRKDGSVVSDESAVPADLPGTQLANGQAVDGAASPVEPGLLKVTVKSAKDLKGVHHHDLPKPYALVRYGKNKFQTNTLGKTHEPAWDETFTLRTSPDRPTFKVELFDSRTLLSDKELGEVEVPIGRYIHPEQGVTSLDVEAELHEGQGLLSLHLDWSATLARVSTSETAPDNASTFSKSPGSKFGSPFRSKDKS